jgi:hypothetical protein
MMEGHGLSQCDEESLNREQHWGEILEKTVVSKQNMIALNNNGMSSTLQPRNTRPDVVDVPARAASSLDFNVDYGANGRHLSLIAFGRGGY